MLAPQIEITGRNNRLRNETHPRKGAEPYHSMSHAFVSGAAMCAFVVAAFAWCAS